ncbi:MAG TPA: DNA polymerase ligase N-terminal domain-containing protein, partial [Acidobacteriaceae bacterium]
MPDTRKSRHTYAQPTDRALTRYRAKRDFDITAEPRGNKRTVLSRDAHTALPFVIQKHAASRLHYDFRLAWDGVLKSWAVAKGPSYYPGDKRLAVQVEDHPLEYGDFEGTIPKGQYGGGTVMVWDTGEWTPLGDATRGFKEGHLKFELRGKKLKGTWALVRMHGKAGGTDKANWLLIKEKDRFAREAAKTPVTEEAPNSASSGRTMEEIARSNDRVWNSSRKGTTSDEKPQIKKPPPKESAQPKRQKRSAPLNINVSGAPRERFPGFIPPQLAQPTTTAPSGGEWTHELKLDGYRIQVLVEPSTKKNSKASRVQLLTRKGLDWTGRMPDIAEAAGELRVESAILDGEAVALDERGVSDFAALQAAF